MDNPGCDSGAKRYQGLTPRKGDVWRYQHKDGLKYETEIGAQDERGGWPWVDSIPVGGAFRPTAWTNPDITMTLVRRTLPEVGDTWLDRAGCGLVTVTQVMGCGENERALVKWPTGETNSWHRATFSGEFTFVRSASAGGQGGKAQAPSVSPPKVTVSPPARPHRFDRYSSTKFGYAGGVAYLCVECGRDNSAPDCHPRPSWRADLERVIAGEMASFDEHPTPKVPERREPYDSLFLRNGGSVGPW